MPLNLYGTLTTCKKCGEHNFSDSYVLRPESQLPDLKTGRIPEQAYYERISDSQIAVILRTCDNCRAEYAEYPLDFGETNG